MNYSMVASVTLSISIIILETAYVFLFCFQWQNSISSSPIGIGGKGMYILFHHRNKKTTVSVLIIEKMGDLLETIE